ncbi:bifunctional 23S rRNA (guanine(2069)-N(7))-methyltransferase RlmK/23S rRNA (guanine(2445)-N(2))-methyltransferase RlmL [Glaciecola sp. XM2]|uniref:bifunctional 23S rRNA (guanine(2069)-N(7))-methyltransferase RlmK/23S rRNA (guanine(2445)-N(2))-methyltransferase RlmL n=1 Tax=Glaciecola sp. XM2 TaxID=1914931 RepID=UPI001BDDD236|nr:bifunctional 23S rRNA (guanine(2069)-N(7))-methyltransferase RlmK/23S rRNA (guanine(2445)-N(2))-methyltransferase RlmL [Glaciecola sp. XM2]MBT1449687.1 bifunctional 23S rRNA (guanine(2069)-N(7))-methyltransferase RlmK/23S rRNA (guanine(2445)-N(2))-methyltransferase RlmL [Glaciecola sp. XM2]
MLEVLLIAAKGLDELLKLEIQQILNEPRDVHVTPGQCRLNVSLEEAYKLNLHTRLANRLLLVVASGKVKNADDIYTLTQQVDWPAQFDVNSSFAIRFNGVNREIRNSQFGSLKIKDAIVDQFAEELGRRPDVSRQDPDVQIHGRLRRETLDICIDFSGESLHQRGYRAQTGDAPLKEQVAAAILMRSGWAESRDKCLLDPMCGSATIAIEAALMATNTPPNLNRFHWGFEHYLGHNRTLWSKVKDAAEAAITKPSCHIYAFDISTKLLDIAKENAALANMLEHITFKQCDALQAQVPESEGFIVSNPPYGERLGDYVGLLPLYDGLGKHLKAHFANWRVSLLSSDQQLLKALKLRTHKKYAINNGKLECILANYVLDTDNLAKFDKDHSEVAQEFANRLIKNQKRLQKWIKREQIQAYRIYDADLPHYNFAIDVYGDHVIVQEYAPPKSLPVAVAAERLQQALLRIPKILACDSSRVVVKQRSIQSGPNQYQKQGNTKQRIVVEEYGAKFYINPSDYLDVGLFLDHRTTRQMFAAKSKGKHVLNLFCYTASVSVHAALHGAKSVTSVDMSKTYINWAKDNFALNSLTGMHTFEQQDCLQWIEKRANGNQPKFDAIFIDPPSFSNSKRMDDTWDVQRDHIALIEKALKCLAPDGFIYFSNNLRKFKLDEQSLLDMGVTINNIGPKTIPEDFARNPKIHHCWELSV